LFHLTSCLISLLALSHFFTSLFAEAVFNAPDIIVLCLEIGACVARGLVFGVGYCLYYTFLTPLYIWHHAPAFMVHGIALAG
jgi:uncharacterized membrane protein (DUF485 family)